jgi:hypothetical protein
MRLVRSVSEDDMVAAFLAAEATSERYGPQIRQILARLGRSHRLVTDPDTFDEAANAVRRQILAAYRGYPTDDVFTGMPADVRWHRAMLTHAELGTVQYIDYPCWTDFSGGTRLAADGARRPGPWAGPAGRDDLPANRGECPGRTAATANHLGQRTRPGEPCSHRRAQEAHRAAGLPAVAAGRTGGRARHYRGYAAIS